MQPYANHGGLSNVRGYEIGLDWIKVQFGDGSIYRYSYLGAGSSNVEQMKRLAVAGRGLNSFIMRNVRYSYDR